MKKRVLFSSTVVIFLAACNQGGALPWHTKAGKQVLELIHAQGPTVSVEVGEPIVSKEQEGRAQTLVATLKGAGYVFGDIPQPGCIVNIANGYEVTCVDGITHVGITHALGVVRVLQEFKERAKK